MCTAFENTGEVVRENSAQLRSAPPFRCSDAHWHKPGSLSDNEVAADRVGREDADVADDEVDSVPGRVVVPRV